VERLRGSILSLLILCIILLTACGPTVTDSGSKGIKVSKAEFDQIQSGMTVSQVEGIVGGAGDLVTESGKAGEDLHTVAYSFDGEGSVGANANFMFQGGKLINKAQAGLK
jgi:hypothetical protein